MPTAVTATTPDRVVTPGLRDAARIAARYSHDGVRRTISRHPTAHRVARRAAARPRAVLAERVPRGGDVGLHDQMDGVALPVDRRGGHNDLTALA